MIRFISSCCQFLVGCVLWFGSVTECFAVPTESVRAHLTKVWQEEIGQTADDSIPTFLPSHYPTEMHRRSRQPHPAVVRVVVREQGATSYGSGTLVDLRDEYGLVITNWHVVRDAQGPVEVRFPCGFTSQARALKVDADWDLAALVIWRPPVKPVKIAAAAPQPGDELTICGYGQGIYRVATGRCTDYYAPRPDFPRQMVELDVEARQGDSGGPIFNRQGELAGVLFGAGQGTTLGSFGGRVGSFLATLAPDIGHSADEAPQFVNVPKTPREATQPGDGCCLPCPQPTTAQIKPHAEESASPEARPTLQDAAPDEAWISRCPESLLDSQHTAATHAGHWQGVSRNSLFEQVKTVLAAVGLLAIAMQMLRAAR